MNIQLKHIRNSQLNKLAGFWIRFFARAIDSVMLAGLTVAVAIPNLNMEESVISFNEPWNFYLWCIVTIIIWPGYFITIPLLTKGYTLGTYLMRIKIQFDKKPFWELVKRECFFSLLFVGNLFLIFVFINHTLINKFFQMNQKEVKYTIMEQFRVAFPTTFMGIGVLTQMIVGISIIVKKGQGINDVFSRTKVVYVNKFIKASPTNERIAKKYRPQLIEQTNIEWVK